MQNQPLQKNKIIQGTFLFQQRKGTSCELMKYEPQTFEHWELLESLVINAFIQPGYLSQVNSYTFTVSNFYAYVWTFQSNNLNYSIVILSEICDTQLFYCFLASLSSNFLTHPFTNSSTTSSPFILKKPHTPEGTFSALNLLLSKWTLKDDILSASFYGFSLQSPLPSTELVENKPYFFDPFMYFEDFPCVSIYRNLLAGQPIAVTSQNPSLLCDAVSALKTLLEPFNFSDQPIICMDSHDPRFEHLSDTLIYGISCPTQEENRRRHSDSDIVPIFQQFTRVLNVNYQQQRDTIKDIPVLKALRQQTQELMSLFLFFMNEALLNDPYNDILEGNFLPEEGSFSKYLKNMMADYVIVKKFTENKIFKSWRKSKQLRPQLREALLSSDDNIFENKSLQQLTKCLKSTNKMLTFFQHDIHVISVLKKHRTILQNKLQSHRM